jgi:hypothetical protein
VAVQRAKAEAVCDEVVTVIPVLGASLLDALDGVAAALAPVAPAADAFDRFVSDSLHKLEITARGLAEQSSASSAQPGVGPRVGTTMESPYAPDAKQPEPEKPKPEPFRRLRYQHLGQTTVDRVPVVPCRGAAQLAAVVLPAFQELGASSALVDHLKELARGAPPIATP